MNRYIKYSVIFVLWVNVFITVLGIVSLYRSPYIGIIYSDLCDSRGCEIGKVDDGSPAWIAGIRPGDVIRDVNDMGLPPVTFTWDPSIVNGVSDLRLFWQSQGRLSDLLPERGPLNILILRDGHEVEVAVNPSDFPLSRIAGRLWQGYLVLCIYVLTGLLIIRKAVDEKAYILFFWLAFAGIGDLSFISFYYRDLIYLIFSLRILSYFNITGLCFGSFTFLHFALLFPRRKVIAVRFPKIAIWLYCIAAVLVIQNVIALHYGIFAITEGVIWMLYPLAALSFLYDLFREKDVIYRRQVQWVVYGFTATIIIRLIIVILPNLIWGKTIIEPDSLFLIPVALMPVIGLAIAVNRYGLMGIESVFDYSLAFGATILVLLGIETGFMSLMLMQAASPLMPTSCLSLCLSLSTCRSAI
ncbi:MAG TPA: PDZ domain-containing protein [Nitrospirota bacterium]|nr:PDZ domain-containing protein [Nitrospirota bacterium]